MKRTLHSVLLILVAISLALPLQAQRYRTLIGHQLDVNALAFTPDGKFLASAGSDRNIILWNVQSGAEQYRYEGHTASVNAVAISPDGHFMASGGSDNTLRIWEVSTGKNLKIYTEHQKPIESVAFGADGATVATASWDRTARLWDTHENWQQEFKGHTNTVYGVALSPDGQLLYSAGADAVVRVWDVHTGQQVRMLEGHRNTVRTVAISPDGKNMATASLDRTVRLWHEAGSAWKVLQGHTDIVRHVAYSPDGRYVVSAGRDGVAIVWDTSTGEQVQQLKGHTAGLWQAVFSPDGKYIATASQDRTIRLWEVSHLNITAGKSEYLVQQPERYKPPVAINMDIPAKAEPQPQRFALIIANEGYSTYQSQVDVEFAMADGLLFAEYCEKRLGIPQRNILVLTNGTSAQMDNELKKLALMAKNYGPKAELYFYYSGHGIPQEGTAESYLLPVDVNAYSPDKALLLSSVVERLNASRPARLTMVLDACFSGQGRGGEQSPIAARGVVIKPKPVDLQGNTVIFAASSGEQAAYPYRQARQGLFSYFMLMQLHQNAELSYGEMAERVESEVSLHALLLFNKPQNPSISVSPDLGDSWKDWTW